MLQEKTAALEAARAAMAETEAQLAELRASFAEVCSADSRLCQHPAMQPCLNVGISCCTVVRPYLILCLVGPNFPGSLDDHLV
jgi:hypothetical protein